MTKYIDKNEAIIIADYSVDEHPYDKDPAKPETFSEYNEGWHDACDYIKERLEDVPAADVEPVVRCKDCKYFSRDKEYNRAWCNYLTGSAETAVNGFCFRGARKDGDTQ